METVVFSDTWVTILQRETNYPGYVPPIPTPHPPPQVGSPTVSALGTVVASDSRITALQLEVELLEADAEGPTAAAALPPAPASQQAPIPKGGGGGDSKASPHPHPHPPAPPPSGGNGGEEPSFMMSELRQEIAKLSLEQKAARLVEVYEDLDVLVKTKPHMYVHIYVRTLIEH